MDASVQSFVDSLPAEARAALEYLAVADPMPLADLSSLAGDDAVRVAGGAGAITVAGDEVRAAHPLYVDAVRARLSPEELGARRGALFERVGSATPA